MATKQPAEKPAARPSKLTVEDWPLSRIKRYHRNPRKNDKAVAVVAQSLKAFGWRQPIVVDGRGVIIVGDTRFRAAEFNGDKTAPVHVAKNLTKEQVKAYRIMDNRAHEEADWDDALLAMEFNDLRLAEFDMALTGFTEQELEGIIGTHEVNFTASTSNAVGDQQFLVAVECTDEAQQQAVFERLQSEGLTCRLIS